MISTSTRTFLAVLIGVAVLWFGIDGSDGKGLSPALLLLALIAAAITWHLTKPENSGAGK
ncbi:MAG TPA: amidophosphoribosyltransferase [Micromonosporaceae bacterium]|nr:amidophosphoribosyltransferase [Micromonosporaceae bacterium]